MWRDWWKWSVESRLERWELACVDPGGWGMMCERRLERGRERDRWIFWRRGLDGRNLSWNGNEWVLRGKGLQWEDQDADALELEGEMCYLR